MQNPLLVILAVLTLGAVYVVLPVVANAYSKYRGVKRPLCPATGEPAEVTLNLRHAVATAAVGHADVKVTPVIDLNGRVRSDQYEHADSLKDLIWLLTGGDVFPYAARSAAMPALCPVYDGGCSHIHTMPSAATSGGSQSE